MTPSPLGHIGRYELLSRLAAGGMGEVFLARATGTGGFEKRLVIKRILPHLADDPEFVRRFIAEGKLVVRLRHAGIAQVLDMGEEEGVTFIAMEYVDGRDLGELARLARTGGVEMPAPLVATIIVRLLEALDYAHTATDDDGVPLGIIHRDISPSNVMISKGGEVKLLDFGIARATERLQATTIGAIRGKFSYMSPQQAAGAALDARSDLFSVGVLMWELLAGARPFDGDSDLLTLDRIRFHDPGPLRAVAPDVPTPVAAVVERLLQKDPDDRYPTAEAAMRALMAWLNEAGAVVVPRDLSEWLDRVLETMPAGLRGVPATGMSLDDVLLMGLGGEAERPGSNTDPASEPRAPYTRTVSAPGDVAPAAQVETSPPASRRLERPTPSQPVAAPTTNPYPTDPVAPVVGAGRTRGRRGVFALLVGLNLLLLAAVAWLVVQAGEDDGGSNAAELMVPDVVSPRDASVAVATSAEEPDADVVMAASDALTVAAVDTTAAVDATAELTAGSAFGALVAAEAERLVPAEAALTIHSTKGALVVVDGVSRGLAPHTVRGRPGTVVTGRISLAGYEARRFSLTLGDDPSISRPLTAIPRGKVRFRFVPANAKVFIDGAELRLDRDENNVALSAIVTRGLAVGRHTLAVVPPTGVGRKLPFDVVEGETTQLGQTSGTP